jgi:L-aspartate oxidase
VDFIVVGSGIAGLTFVRQAAQRHSTLVLTKKDRAESNTNYAQGGIAGVVSDDDTEAEHAGDTIKAGAGLCREDAVAVLVSEGPDRIRDLIALGARFSTERDATGSEHLALGREGGHGRNRIVHAVDRTGWECERALLGAVRDLPYLRVVEHCFVLDLAIAGVGGERRCVGVYALDIATGRLRLFRSRAVILASGGCGRIYLHTTNPDIATGDGVAMAWRAGAPVANMEFIQFHPTTLYHPHGRSFLISEAVRGEGGILRTADGSTFMDRYHPLGELAPRDIVARAIHSERLERGEPCVYLDVTHLGDDFIRRRFPTIHARCLELGLDIASKPIPVVPAAHYMCGGVLTDLHGRTGLPGLYAAGEVACTGVHGANRLASNSLLEAMVFGHRAAMAAVDEAPLRPSGPAEPIGPAAGCGSEAPPPAVLGAARRHLRAVMHDYVAIVRNDSRLATAASQIERFRKEASDLVGVSRRDVDIYELRNMADVAGLVVRSALMRKESRGLHYNSDHPETDPGPACDTVLGGSDREEVLQGARPYADLRAHADRP